MVVDDLVSQEQIVYDNSESGMRTNGLGWVRQPRPFVHMPLSANPSTFIEKGEESFDDCGVISSSGAQTCYP